MHSRSGQPFPTVDESDMLEAAATLQYLSRANVGPSILQASSHKISVPDIVGKEQVQEHETTLRQRKVVHTPHPRLQGMQDLLNPTNFSSGAQTSTSALTSTKNGQDQGMETLSYKQQSQQVLIMVKPLSRPPQTGFISPNPVPASMPVLPDNLCQKGNPYILPHHVSSLTSQQVVACGSQKSFGSGTIAVSQMQDQSNPLIHTSSIAGDCVVNQQAQQQQLLRQHLPGHSAHHVHNKAVTPRVYLNPQSFLQYPLISPPQLSTKLPSMPIPMSTVIKESTSKPAPISSLSTSNQSSVQSAYIPSFTSGYQDSIRLAMLPPTLGSYSVATSSQTTSAGSVMLQAQPRRVSYLNPSILVPYESSGIVWNPPHALMVQGIPHTSYLASGHQAPSPFERHPPSPQDSLKRQSSTPPPPSPPPPVDSSSFRTSPQLQVKSPQLPGKEVSSAIPLPGKEVSSAIPLIIIGPTATTRTKTLIRKNEVSTQENGTQAEELRDIDPVGAQGTSLRLIHDAGSFSTPPFLRIHPLVQPKSHLAGATTLAEQDSSTAAPSIHISAASQGGDAILPLNVAATVTSQHCDAAPPLNVAATVTSQHCDAAPPLNVAATTDLHATSPPPPSPPPPPPPQTSATADHHDEVALAPTEAIKPQHVDHSMHNVESKAAPTAHMSQSFTHITPPDLSFAARSAASTHQMPAQYSSLWAAKLRGTDTGAPILEQGVKVLYQLQQFPSQKTLTELTPSSHGTQHLKSHLPLVDMIRPPSVNTRSAQPVSGHAIARCAASFPSVFPLSLVRHPAVLPGPLLPAINQSVVEGGGRVAEVIKARQMLQRSCEGGPAESLPCRRESLTDNHLAKVTSSSDCDTQDEVDLKAGPSNMKSHGRRRSIGLSCKDRRGGGQGVDGEEGVAASTSKDGAFKTLKELYRPSSSLSKKRKHASIDVHTEIVRLERKLKTLKQLFESLETENSELRIKERLMRVKSEGADRMLLCWQTLLPRRGVNALITDEVLQGFRSPLLKAKLTALISGGPKDIKSFTKSTFISVWELLVHELSLWISLDQRRPSYTGSDPKTLIWLASMVESVTKWIATVSMHHRRLLSEIYVTNMSNGKLLAPGEQFWMNVVKKLQLTDQQKHDFQDVWRLHKDQLQGLTIKQAELQLKLSSIFGKSWVISTPTESPLVALLKDEKGNYLDPDDMISVFETQFRAMRAHDVMVTSLIRQLLTPLQLCTAVVASFPSFPNMKALLKAAVSLSEFGSAYDMQPQRIKS